MDETKYIWHDGEFVCWNDAKVHLLTHTLHYGAGLFEGIRAYMTDKGPAVFRLSEHLDRFIYGANAIKLELPYGKEEIIGKIKELIVKNDLQECYVRPLAYYGYGKMGLNPKGAAPKVSVACWPWGDYLPFKMVKVKTSSFIRIHPDSTVADAKICGHYVNSIMAVQELYGTDYNEALFLDCDGNVAEGPGENLFIVKNGEILTPPLGKILAGITRDTVIQLAKHLNYPVKEVNFKVDDIYQADEAFFTGTAAEVAPIGSLDDKQISTEIGPVTKKIKELYGDVVHGKVGEFQQFLTLVS